MSSSQHPSPGAEDRPHQDTDADRDPLADDPGSAPPGGASESAQQAERAAESPESPDGPVESDEEELPEREPLTPDLVEEEALRGDFVLRWAVVLLALLLGFTEIAETRALVHIRAGEAIAANGGLPPRTDVFSYTAEDRPWINLAWLFDLTAAGFYGLGALVGLGAVGLSLVKALTAAVTFGILVHISRPGVSTWWGSVCVALAVLACHPQFTAEPELVTLLGLTLTWALVHHWRQGDSPRLLWALPVVFLLWANLDPRMFLGLGLLVLYGGGEGIGHLLGRSGFANRSRRREFWAVVGVCFAAALLNPFGWHSLSAPWRLYAVEYPAWQAYYLPLVTGHELAVFPLTAPAFREHLPHSGLAALVLIAAAVVTLILNRKQFEPAHALVLAGFAGLGVAAVHELSAAAIVASVIALLNAQDWYRANFRQTYSVDTGELLFSRGGRGLTVLCLFALGYLAVSGRLTGPDGRRIGLGLEAPLQTQIDGLREDLKDSFDNRPFNFRLRQGDLLIWLGRRPFVDNRVALYHGSGSEDLLRRHDRTRRALRRGEDPDSADERRRIWRASFDEFGVTHVIPRLSPPNPDYRTYFDLLYDSENWQMTRLGSMTAVFYRTDLDDPDLKSYLASHRPDFSEALFRTETESPPMRPGWARSRSLYERYLALPQNVHPVPVWRAMHAVSHADHLLQRGSDLQFSEVIALLHLAVREANRGLAENPQSALGYRVLGQAYQLLDRLETQIARMGDGRYLRRRFYQAVMAYSQAVRIEPNDMLAHSQLAELYAGRQRLDLALRSLNRLRDLRESRGDATPLPSRYRELRQQLAKNVRRISAQVEQRLESDADRLETARTAYASGCVLKALEVLQEAPEFVQGHLRAQVLKATLLTEAGRPREAHETILEIEPLASRIPGLSWRTPAALAGLGHADYDRACRLWNGRLERLETEKLTQLTDTLPLVAPPVEWSHVPLQAFVGLRRWQWPLLHAQSGVRVLNQHPAEAARLQFNMAVSHLEAGTPEAAETALRDLLKRSPGTRLRPLVRFYLYHLSGELIDPIPPTDRIPVSTELFAPPAERSRPQPVSAPDPVSGE